MRASDTAEEAHLAGTRARLELAASARLEATAPLAQQLAKEAAAALREAPEVLGELAAALRCSAQFTFFTSTKEYKY